MTRRKAISILIALSLIVLTIPTSKAATDEWVVSTVDEDLFYAANRFEGVDMLYLQGQDMQINSWFWFEGPVMQAGRYIIEAYLEVTTPSIGSTDLDASMTLYGIPALQGGTPSNAEDPSFINGPYTVNSVNVNLSSFVGVNVKHNITVTNILREINQGYYFWDGHDVGLTGLSASGGAEERSVATIEAGHPAKLYIHYGEPSYPPGLPPDGSVVEEYRNYTIWEIPSPDVNVTDMTEVDDPGKITIYNETTFSWSNINKNTLNVSLGYLTNITGQDNITSFTKNFNFSVTVNSHNAAQVNPNAFFLLSELPLIGTLNQIFAGNELICFDIMTTSTVGYQFLAREYGTGTGNGGLSSILSENTWYRGKVTLDGTLWLLQVYNFATGAFMTSSQRTLSGINVRSAVMPMAGQGHGVSGSVDSGWMILPEPEGSIFLITDENGTVIPTWNGENCTTLECIKAAIDEEIGYPDPEDPNPPGWDEDGLLTRFNFKLIIFMIGMILFTGAPVYGLAERPEGATWIIIFFLMLVGVSLLWSLQTM